MDSFTGRILPSFYSSSGSVLRPVHVVQCHADDVLHLVLSNRRRGPTIVVIAFLFGGLPCAIAAAGAWGSWGPSMLGFS
jgi:hypothetical protein